MSETKGYPIDGLFSDSEFSDLDELVLMLAHVYNDLKAALIFWEVNREFAAPPPEAGKVCKFFGQNVGLENYSFRLQIGILVELLKLLKDKQSHFAKPLWKMVLKKIPKQARLEWEKLISLVKGASKAGTFEKRLHTFMVKIRAHGAYHYYQTEPFAEGYLQHFSATGPEAAYAYVCIGKNLEETRFFFADAAISTITNSWKADLGGTFDNEFRAYLRATHAALRAVVCVYFKVRKVPYKNLEE